MIRKSIWRWMILDIKRKKKEKRIQVVGSLIGICVAVVSLFYFFPRRKSGSREKNGGDCKLCQSAVLHLHPL